MDTAYQAGAYAAKVAFLGELYDQYVRGNEGPFAASLFTDNPAFAAAPGAAVQAFTTPPTGSKILRSLGVAGGAAAANALIAPTARLVASAAITALGLDPAIAKAVADESFHPAQLLKALMTELPPGLAQGFAAGKGRDAAVHLEKHLKGKGVTVP